MRISNQHRGPGFVLTLAVMAMMALAAFARPAGLPAPVQGPGFSVSDTASQAAIEALNATSQFLARQQESARSGPTEMIDDGVDDDREAQASPALLLSERRALPHSAALPGHVRPHAASTPARLYARAPPLSLTA